GFRFTPTTCGSATTITTSGTTDLCPSGSVDLEAMSGADTYQWYLDGVAIPGPTGTAQMLTNVSASGKYVALPILGGCGYPSNVVEVTNNPTAAPSVTITSDPSPVCGAISATFTANPTD